MLPSTNTSNCPLKVTIENISQSTEMQHEYVKNLIYFMNIMKPHILHFENFKKRYRKDI